MRNIARLLLPLGAAAAIMAATAASASASVSWPANCEIKQTTAARWACTDKHMNALDARLRVQGAQLATARSQVASLRARNRRLNACIGEFPVTKRDMYDNWYFGSDTNGDGNFDQNNYGGQYTPEMLEQTQPTWGVDIWMVRDLCTPGAYNRPVAP